MDTSPPTPTHPPSLSTLPCIPTSTSIWTLSQLMPSFLRVCGSIMSLCVKDGSSVPFTPWCSVVPWQCFPYMHITHRRTCANTHTYCTEQCFDRSDEETKRRWACASSPPSTLSSLPLHTDGGFSWKKKEALDVVPSAKVNRDGLSRSLSPQGWVTSGRLKKPIHRRRWLEETGASECQAFHSTQWTHYYDIYKAGYIDTAWYVCEKGRPLGVTAMNWTERGGRPQSHRKLARPDAP